MRIPTIKRVRLRAALASHSSYITDAAAEDFAALASLYMPVLLRISMEVVTKMPSNRSISYAV